MPEVRFDIRSLPWKLGCVVLLVLVLDQLTKVWALANFAYAEATPVTPFFYFTLRYNEGAAFSFLAGAGGWQRWFFTLIAVVMSAVLLIWMTRLHRRGGKHLEALALAFILGGALGNLYDRVTLGHVVDFIVLHHRQYEWPAFNIADAGICIGAALLVWDLLQGQKAKNE